MQYFDVLFPPNFTNWKSEHPENPSEFLLSSLQNLSELYKNYFQPLSQKASVCWVAKTSSLCLEELQSPIAETAYHAKLTESLDKTEQCILREALPQAADCPLSSLHSTLHSPAALYFTLVHCTLHSPALYSPLSCTVLSTLLHCTLHSPALYSPLGSHAQLYL